MAARSIGLRVVILVVGAILIASVVGGMILY